MRALVGVAVAGFVLGLAALALVLTGDHDTITGPFVVLALTLGWSFIGTGLYALWRRPEPLIGRLMTIVGFLWFIGALPESDSALAATPSASRSAGSGPPRSCTCWSRSRPGRSSPGSSGASCGSAYGLALVQPIALLFAAEPVSGLQRLPGQPPADRSTTRRPTASSTALLGVASVAMLAGRRASCWSGAGAAPGRCSARRLAPVLWTGAAVAVVGVASMIPQVAGAQPARPTRSTPR